VLPLTAIWVAALIVARDQNRAPPLWLAIIMTVWVNMYGSAIAGLFIVSIFAAEAVIEAAPGQRRQAFLSRSLFGLAALLASLCNPYGLDALAFPFRLMNMKTLTLIGEWMAPNLNSHAFYGLDMFLAALVGCAFALPVRVAPIRAAVVVALIGMTMMHIRHEMLLVLIATMLLAGPIAGTLEHKEVLGRRRAARVAVLAFVLVGLAFGPELLPVERTVGWPVSALKSVPSAIRSRRVYNDVGYGESLIFAGVRPFIDRVELYGNAGSEFPYSFLDSNDIDWTIGNPKTNLDNILDADPKWLRIYRDQFTSVHVRKSVWEAVENGALTRQAG
jgi:hypothetical protein